MHTLNNDYNTFSCSEYGRNLGAIFEIFLVKPADAALITDLVIRTPGKFAASTSCLTAE